MRSFRHINNIVMGNTRYAGNTQDLSQMATMITL